ncbi:phosphatase PAP2 family protein [Flavobacterium cellulosilyticum]|uniref:Phosphatase PAP2 family protein n=1 Tax=Flavobacterium cellulosilyticum TaxID=2541731 RepID=A0A4R5CCE8_9FLAO|nr:phosphatase PAP2 family protein [Flavobacterium cellulosilyticum]TDD95950.1 phosphatase PAP2 family protein [Flavobacterium cellulosilyticum]
MKNIINSIVLILFALFFANIAKAQNFDINELREINLERNKTLDPTFKLITNSASPISIAAPLLIYSVGLLNKDVDLKKKGIFIGETFLVNAVITTALKYAVKRDRPFVTYPDIEKMSSGGSGSFPSGHTSEAFATATSLSLAFPKWYVIAPSFIWASAVGYSRMDLGVHYPSDVAAGAIIGAGSAYLSYKLNKWINKKKQKSVLFDGQKE